MNIKLEMSILGNQFEPDELTKALQVQPTQTWQKGDIVKGYSNIIKRKESNWSYSVGILDTLLFEEYANKLLDKLGNKTTLIKEFSLKNNLIVKLFIVLEVSEDQTPAFYLNKSFLKFVNDLGAEIDVDMYVT